MPNIPTFRLVDHQDQRLYNARPSNGISLLLTADPSPLVDDTWWMVRTGSSPTTVSLKARIGGVTYVIASMEF